MFWYEVLILAVVLAVDIVSKYAVCAALGVVNGVQTAPDITVIPHTISFSFSKNTGASFGIFAGSATSLAVFTGIAMVALVVFLFMSKKENKFLRVCLILILGGGLGNFYDRVFLGYVRDFIHTEFVSFPTYNFADCFLTVATVAVLFYAVFIMPKEMSAEHISADDGEQAVLPAYPFDEIRGELLVADKSDIKDETNKTVADKIPDEDGTDAKV